ncbi:CoA transferase, partial [bacterium]|nr:CoA transferase [bacterium]
YHLYETKDNHVIALGALEDKFWFVFCDVINKAHFKNIGFDEKNNDKVIKELKTLFKSHNASYWTKFSERYDVCLTVYIDEQEMLRRGYVKKASLKHGRQHYVIGQSRAIAKNSREYYHHSGQDNMKILRKLGYTTRGISQLVEEGVIYK